VEGTSGFLTNSEIGDIGSSSTLNRCATVEVTLDLAAFNVQVSSEGVRDSAANLAPLRIIGLGVASDINEGLEVSRAVGVVVRLSDHSYEDNEASERTLFEIAVDVALSDNTRVNIMNNVCDVANIENPIRGARIGPHSTLMRAESRTSLTTDSELLTTASIATVRERAETTFRPLKATDTGRAKVADSVSGRKLIHNGRRGNNIRIHLTMSRSNDGASLTRAESRHGFGINSGVSTTADTPMATFIGTTAIAAVRVSEALAAQL
jgi:hypothetical protein